MDFAQQLFQQLTDANEAAAEHARMGRELAFREVRAWIDRNADPATGRAHVESLRALCEERSK